MALAGDVFSITVHQSIQAQEILNVFFYKLRTSVTSEPTFLTDLLAVFELQVIQTWLPAVTDDVLFTKSVARNLFNDAEYTEVGYLNKKGTRTGSLAGSRYAVFIPFRRTTALTRSGGKRIAGYASSDFLDNTLSSTAQGLFDALATKMDQILEVPNTASPYAVLDPVLVKRIPYTTPTGKQAYRLPNNQSESVTNLFTSNTASTKPSTQNSRKV